MSKGVLDRSLVCGSLPSIRGKTLKKSLKFLTTPPEQRQLLVRRSAYLNRRSVVVGTWFA
jgi:hypothetical protein